MTLWCVTICATSHIGLFSQSRKVTCEYQSGIDSCSKPLLASEGSPVYLYFDTRLIFLNIFLILSFLTCGNIVYSCEVEKQHILSY